MPLSEPPATGELRRLPAERLAGRKLYRLYNRRRASPWWFASAPRDAAEGGRFDLPAPDGTCYFGTTSAAATLEGLQDLLGTGLLHRSVLERLALAEIAAPATAPVAAKLTTARATALGVTAGLWADADRALTQRWAAALHRVWEALYAGIQHDPTGRARAVALFDAAGEHPPAGRSRWRWTTRPAADDPRVASTLTRHGLVVVGDGDLPVVAWREPAG